LKEIPPTQFGGKLCPRKKEEKYKEEALNSIGKGNREKI
jgi:hypothetical protein